MAQGYSAELKNSIVSRLLSNELSIRAAIEQYGICRQTLYRWRREALNDTIGAPQQKQSDQGMKRLNLPKNVSYLQAHRAVALMEELDDTQFGIYCRKNGLTTDAVKEWKAWFEKHPGAVSIEELQNSQKQARHLQQENLALNKRIGQQEKALAKAGTMLLMSKKPWRSLGKRQANLCRRSPAHTGVGKRRDGARAQSGRGLPSHRANGTDLSELVSEAGR